MFTIQSIDPTDFAIEDFVRFENPPVFNCEKKAFSLKFSKRALNFLASFGIDKVTFASPRQSESTRLDASSELFLASIEREIETLPKITRLDEYMHFREQLEQMRARSIEFNEARFAMEMAVFCILLDYEESLGLPARTMPRPDGKGGVEPEPVVPKGWWL